MTKEHIRQIAITALISPELLVLLLAVACGALFGSHIATAMQSTAVSDAHLRFVIAAPISLLLLGLNGAKEILFPDTANRHVLHTWPDYPLLQDTYYIGLAYLLIFTAIAAGFYISPISPKSAFGTPMLSASVLGSIVSYATLFHAKNTVRHILEKEDAPTNP